MTWYKKNLITKEGKFGMYDIWECSECSFKKKYYGLHKPTSCPNCDKTKTIYGCWSYNRKSVCPYCKSKLVICPKVNHPNSKFWLLQKNNKESLLVCPKGCLESGEGKNRKAAIRKPIKIRRRII